MSNKQKDIDTILELNKSDPSLTYPEIIKRLKLNISPSTLGRWVSSLKKDGKWVSPGQQKDESLEELALKVQSLDSSLSKLAMSKRLGISRHKLTKVLAYIANSNDINVKSSDTITTTSNNVVSITPNSAKAEAFTPFNCIQFLNRSGKAREIIVLEVTSKKRVKYLDVTCNRALTKPSDLNEFISSLEEMPINEAALTTLKRNKDITIRTTTGFLDFCIKRMEKVCNRSITFITKTTIMSEFGANNTERVKLNYESILQEYNNLYSHKNSNSDPREDTENSETNVVQAPEVKDLKKEISRVESLIEVMGECPHRAVLTESSITIYDGLKGHTVNREQEALFNKCLDLIETKQWVKLKDACFSRVKAGEEQKVNFKKFGFDVKSGFVVFGENGGLGSLSVKGLDTIIARSQHYLSEGDEKGFEKIGNFISKLTMNPDMQVINRIVDFIKFKDIEITPEGDLIVYKIVSNQYKDCHTKTVDNSVGSTVFMRRLLVDSHEKNVCSNGLHVCALNYFGSFAGRGDKLISCRLNPEDIVSIPADYNGSKIRCCKYVVLADVTSEFISGKLKADLTGEFASLK